jgi:hypothetical protein
MRQISSARIYKINAVYHRQSRNTIVLLVSGSLQPSTEDNLRINFQRLIYTESLAYTQLMAPNKHPLSVLGLQQIGAMAGHEFLQFLDRKLKPDTLKICTKAELQSLCLLLLVQFLRSDNQTGGGQFRFSL